MARHPNDRPARPLGKRLIASLLAVTLTTTPLVSHPADLNAEMQAMFNDLGALGNVTTPGAFRGQAMNLYTGGSLMMRAPGRNYPLATVQLPSLRAGCGGIDMFLGGFSFLNVDYLVQKLQNILSAAPAAAGLHAGHVHSLGFHAFEDIRSAQILSPVYLNFRRPVL